MALVMTTVEGMVELVIIPGVIMTSMMLMVQDGVFLFSAPSAPFQLLAPVLST